MSTPCAYHADREAQNTCAECDAAVCGECRRSYEGRLVCWKCALALSRIGAPLPRDAAAMSMVAAPDRASNPPKSSPSTRASAGNSRSLQGILAFAAGFTAMVVGTVFIEQVVFQTHFYMLTFAYVALAYAVGTLLGKVGRQPSVGTVLSTVSMVILVQLYGYAMLANDIAHKHGNSIRRHTHFVALHALPPIILPVGIVSLLASAAVVYRAAIFDTNG